MLRLALFVILFSSHSLLLYSPVDSDKDGDNAVCDDIADEMVSPQSHHSSVMMPMVLLQKQH